MAPLTGKKALLVIARTNFRDEEYAEPRKALEAAGVQVAVASSKQGQCRGMLGATANADIALRDAKAINYDAVVFVGGSGAQEYWNDGAAHKLAIAAVQLGRVVGAICIAPVVLAKAGLLKGRRATVFPSCEEQLAVEGAHVTRNPVERDGKIITAVGPQAARDFAKALVKALGA